MALQYQRTQDGKIGVDVNGHPLVFDDEKEDAQPFGLDAVHLHSKIPALQAEAKGYREERDGLKKRLVPLGDTPVEDLIAKVRKLEEFGDISPQKAKEALDLVANLKDVDEQNAIKIERVKAGVAESYEAKIRDLDIAYGKKLEALEGGLKRKDGAIRDLLVKGAFDRSEFIREGTVLTPDIAYDSFGRYFVVEEDENGLHAYALDRGGEKIFSRQRPGEYASPEEAIELLISEYPRKDSILRTTAGGSGAAGNSSQRGSQRSKMAELRALPATERLKRLRQGV